MGISLPIGKKYAVAIEIDKNYLKIAQAQFSSKGIIISKLITETIVGFSGDDISKALADAVSRNNIRVENLVAVIAREKTMVRYIRFPATSPEEIESMVSFEIGKQIPYSQEEIISDYKLLETDEEGYSEVMLVVAHKDEILKLNSILNVVGASISRVALSSETALNLLKVGMSERLKGKDVCFVDIDTDNTEITIISNERLGFNRVSSIGCTDITKSKSDIESHSRRLVQEIKSSIALYKNKKNRSASVISEFLVAGAGSVINNFCDILKEETGINCEPIEALSMFTLADGALTEKGIAPDASVSAVCGSLFTTLGINLVPEELKKKQRFGLNLKKAVNVAVIFGGLLLFIITGVSIKYFQKITLLSQMKKMLSQINPQAEAVEERLKRLEIIRSQSKEGESSLDAIYHLYKLIPNGISLIDFDYDDRSNATRFRGRSNSMSGVFRLATILEDSGIFSNVDTRSVTKRSTKSGDIVDFQIRCTFVPIGDKA